MLAAHQWVAVAAIAAAFVAAVWGFVVWRRRTEPGPFLQQTLVLVQTLLVAQVAIGLLLVGDDRRTADDLHYVYGTLALCAVLAPWFYAPEDSRRRLAWFSFTSLLAGALAVRAYFTSG
jgi:peptidoglycan biosynthesis protein MviN/MurJ (putative lipid II flippase)